MKVQIEGTPAEIKELLQAISGSEEQEIVLDVNRLVQILHDPAALNRTTRYQMNQSQQPLNL